MKLIEYNSGGKMISRGAMCNSPLLLNVHGHLTTAATTIYLMAIIMLYNITWYIIVGHCITISMQL